MNDAPNATTAVQAGAMARKSVAPVTMRCSCAMVWESCARGKRFRVGIVLCLFGLLLAGGCASDKWARLRARPFNPLTRPLGLDSRSGPQPTQRTLQMLRRNDLAKFMDDESPVGLVSRVQLVTHQEPTADNVYATAEVAYIGAAQLKEAGDLDPARNLYAMAAANAYVYLFGGKLERGRNPYDPRFRRACDLYNNSLETTLRYLQQQDLLKPGTVHTIESGKHRFDFEIAPHGTWQEQSYCELRFVSDFKVQELKNTYRTYGLGVPLIAVYESKDDATDAFYPDGMSFPVTAFMRVDSISSPNQGETHYRCTIELRDTLAESEVLVEGQTVPLEVDLTTPLAYTLDNPMFRQANVAANGLFKPEKSLAASGVYMLEPYDPAKIPVVMVHGFWSSLVTWMEMFNDLRGSPEIRENYQFWFYLYPTGGPFWYSGAHLRRELAEVRNTFDPHHRAVALDQMVLVGHSMGGLVSKLQVTDSADDFWRLVSDRPISEVRGDAEDLSNLTQAFYFQPNPSIRRVVTIATPFRGSNFSNMATQWLGDRLINLPEVLIKSRSRLSRDNPRIFLDNGLLDITTSVQSLSPECAFLRTLDQKQMAPWVRHHNIIGDLNEVAVISRVAEGTDGIVKENSARAPLGAVSEIRVAADHVSVHRKPRAILEVRRILLEHLSELRANHAVSTAPLALSQIPPVVP